MDLEKTINFKLLAEAIDFYSKKNYKNIPLDWKVDLESAIATTPKHVNLKESFFKDNFSEQVWVGSAEQSFVDLTLKHQLAKGKYQGTTPCFRNELIVDNLHKKYFMKTELFISDDTSKESLSNIIDDAFEFFLLFFPLKDLNIVQTDYQSYDIEFRGIELGSYGIRNYNDISWIYGTGCAEARLTYCLTLL